jgi:hypothetical protein
VRSIPNPSTSPLFGGDDRAVVGDGGLTPEQREHLVALLHGLDTAATLGLLVVVLLTAASLQDRDGGRLVLARARMAMPSIVLVWADGGYAGRWQPTRAT